jgi:DNA-directed RNA polymerase I and III subunit RPAC1
MCRECIRKEGWSDRVELNRVSDHFIFTVESSGCIPPEVIVREVGVRVRVLRLILELG